LLKVTLSTITRTRKLTELLVLETELT
jgi:hypothetical protein